MRLRSPSANGFAKSFSQVNKDEIRRASERAQQRDVGQAELQGLVDLSALLLNATIKLMFPFVRAHFWRNCSPGCSAIALSANVTCQLQALDQVVARFLPDFVASFAARTRYKTNIAFLCTLQDETIG